MRACAGRCPRVGARGKRASRYHYGHNLCSGDRVRRRHLRCAELCVRGSAHVDVSGGNPNALVWGRVVLPGDRAVLIHSVRSLAFKMPAFVATLLSVRRPGDYLVYGAILALVTCGNNLFNLIRLHKLLDFKSVGRLDVRRHIMPLMVFGAQAIAQSVYLSFNSTMLGVLSHGNYQVGLHQLAVKIEHVQCGVVGAVTGVFVPRIAHDQIADDVAGFRRLVRTVFGFTMNICVAVMCYLLVFAEPVVPFVSGEAFAGAVTPVR